MSKSVALIGNPNAGKTSIFNHLTGLNQKIGNYPGITVDKKVGYFSQDGVRIKVLDLPGTYSIYPKSLDEQIVYEVLTDRSHPDHPELVVVVVDATNLERNLLLFSQVYDMGLPCMLVLNMVDEMARKRTKLDVAKLSELFNEVPVLETNGRKGMGIPALKSAIAKFHGSGTKQKLVSGEFEGGPPIPDLATQKKLSEERFKKIGQVLRFCYEPGRIERTGWRHKLDRVLTHPITGYACFALVLLLIFQAVFAWSEWPMGLIDGVFLKLSQLTVTTFPEGPLTSLVAEGIIPGLAGVLIFIPQIALLFGFIFLLEETGYMARVVFIMDRLMKPFGLNGRSVVPLISGVACAIPAVMATRTIDNWKERVTTIMVTPLMSCSARLPVYTLLIALVIPDIQFWGFNLKGLTLMGLYLLGTVAAIGVAWLMKLGIRSKQASFLIMELPAFKAPRWNNLWITILEKVKVFVFEAGKVIMAISIILWLAATYGPGDRIETAVSEIPIPTQNDQQVLEVYHQQVSSVSLANSYVGILGRSMEPVIAPLGYNWQIGIALITSFAAREVFVGSMATIYSVGEDFEEDKSLLERMRNEKNPEGTAVYTLASGISLMVFYAFAMQCMSTLAVVYRETKSWKWPVIQLLYMTVMAYVAALTAYQLLN